MSKRTVPGRASDRKPSQCLIRGLGKLAKEGTKLETVVTSLIRIKKHQGEGEKVTMHS